MALGPLFTAAAEALARDRKPIPTRSVRHDADRFVFARNSAVGVDAGLQPASLTVPAGARKSRGRKHPEPVVKSSDLGGSTTAATRTEADSDTIASLAELKQTLRQLPPSSKFYDASLSARIEKPHPMLREYEGWMVHGYIPREPEQLIWQKAWKRAWAGKSQAQSQRARVFWRALALGFPVLPFLFGLAFSQWTPATHLGIGNGIAFTFSLLVCLWVGCSIKVQLLGFWGETRLGPVYREYEGWFVENYLPRRMLPLRILVIAGVFLAMLYKGPQLGLSHVGNVALDWLAWRF